MFISFWRSCGGWLIDSRVKIVLFDYHSKRINAAEQKSWWASCKKKTINFDGRGA
jgi:hypothetical protein